MRKTSLSMVAASLFLGAVGLASAQSTTTTTTSTQWTPDQGRMFTEYSTTKKYESYSEPSWKPSVGIPMNHVESHDIDDDLDFSVAEAIAGNGSGESEETRLGGRVIRLPRPTEMGHHR